MPFPYYERLSPRRQAIYRQSDRVVALPVPRPGEIQPLVDQLRLDLAGDNRRAVEKAACALSAGLLAQFRLEPLAVQVLAVRPHGGYGELHGLYTFGEKDPPRIRVWMRTARQRRVVAFRSFLRTLLHELMHHLDYRYLKLADSYHTEGFFKRESSLFRQIVPELELAPGLPGQPRRRPAHGKSRPAAASTARRAVAKRQPAAAAEPQQASLLFDPPGVTGD